MALLIMQFCDLIYTLHTDPINAHIIIHLDTLGKAAKWVTSEYEWICDTRCGASFSNLCLLA